jgi:hypothetical protein
LEDPTKFEHQVVNVKFLGSSDKPNDIQVCKFYDPNRVEISLEQALEWIELGSFVLYEMLLKGDHESAAMGINFQAQLNTVTFLKIGKRPERDETITENDLEGLELGDVDKTAILGPPKKMQKLQEENQSPNRARMGGDEAEEEEGPVRAPWDSSRTHVREDAGGEEEEEPNARDPQVVIGEGYDEEP